MIDGKIVPYTWMNPPGYTGKNLMKSYQGQLKEAGFLDNGNVGRGVYTMTGETKITFRWEKHISPDV